MADELVKYEPLSPEVRANMLASESSMFLNVAKFEQYCRVAQMIAKTTFIPVAFQNNVGNCMIALNLAERMRADPILLMQAMYVVHGRPGFEGKFLSALVNNSGRYEGKLKYEWKGTPGSMDYGCRAWAVLKGTDERVDGPWVDWRMVKDEGWDKPKGTQVSKWNTMRDVMFFYRAATFFCRVHDSNLMMGMSTLEELEDSGAQELVRGPGGTYAVGDGPKPEGIYDVNKEAPKPSNDVKKEEAVGSQPNVGGTDGNGLAGSGNDSQEDKSEKKDEAPPQGEKTPEEGAPSHCSDSSGNDEKVDINAITGPWNPKTWINLKSPGVKKHAETFKERFTEQPVELRNHFADKWSRCADLPNFPFDDSGAWIGYDAPQQAESSEGIKKDAIIEEEDPNQIMLKLGTYMGINHPDVQIHMFRNYLATRSADSGVPVYEYAKNIMAGQDQKFVDAFNAWMDVRM